MDPARVRFIHDANTDHAKARLFAACRNGDVDVLIGSTDKLATGVNVQARLIALHHLDVPWRPADIEQREGRILRQSNQNPTVHIVRYVTTASFDPYMWIVNRTRGSTTRTRPTGTMTSEQSYSWRRSSRTSSPRIRGVTPCRYATWQ
jgi:Helicase conserved C-terminal domain